MRSKAIKQRIFFGFACFFSVCLICLTGTIYYYKLSYPLKYKDIILTNCAEYNLEPALVASIINAESGYNKFACSRAGAYGLMQMLPSTGAYVAESLGVSFIAEDLFDEHISIKFGCWYLRYLSDKFSSSRLAITAYNAGEGTVRKWLKDTNLSNGAELISIPYQETQNYVKKVTNGKEIYQRLLQ